MVHQIGWWTLWGMIVYCWNEIIVGWMLIVIFSGEYAVRHRCSSKELCVECSYYGQVHGFARGVFGCLGSLPTFIKRVDATSLLSRFLLLPDFLC